jgi:hypothetical protein
VHLDNNGLSIGESVSYGAANSLKFTDAAFSTVRAAIFGGRHSVTNGVTYYWYDIFLQPGPGVTGAPATPPLVVTRKQTDANWTEDYVQVNGRLEVSESISVTDDLRLTEVAATPATPAAGVRYVYTRDNGVYEQDDAGTEERLTGAKCRLDEPIYPPTATVTLTAGNVNVGTHSWKLSYVDALGLETDASAKSNVGTVASSAKQVTVVTPIGPPGVSQRKLYRTVAGDTGDWKLVTTIANNTTTSVTDNTADANLGAAAPTSDVTIGRPAFPVRGVIWGDTISQRWADGTAKTIDITVNASQMYGFYGGSVVAGADDGDYFAGSIYLAAGTYSTYLLGIKANNQGKFDVYVDGVKINASTYDAYASATAYNQVYAESGVVIAQDGMHLVVIKINSKHASSADYAFRLTKLEFYPAYE